MNNFARDSPILKTHSVANNHTMSTPKKSAVPTIEEIPLKDLVVNTDLSGRDAKELAVNAKEKAAQLDAFGGWDITQPGAYFVRDGKKHLIRGFSRFTAAKDILGLKAGYFVEIPDNPGTNRTDAIRSNTGRQISQFKQGEIYAGMAKGGDAETAKAGEVVLAPMSCEEIAKEVGYTSAHIGKCIAIFESSPEIQELIGDGKVAAGIVTVSRRDSGR